MISSSSKMISFMILLALISIPSNIVAQHDSSVFTNIFKSKRNSFDSLFALSSLIREDRENICNEFNENGNMTTDNLINLVYLSPNSTVHPKTKMPAIPAFLCFSRIGDHNYYITYSTLKTDNPFFKMESIKKSDKHENVYVEIISAKTISTYNKVTENLETKIRNYFSSENYRQKAEKYFTHFIQDGIWHVLCQELTSDYKIPEGIDRISVRNIETIIYENQEPITIPVLPCPINEEFRDDIFFVAYHTDEIFFKVDIGSNLEPFANYDLNVFF